MKKYCCFLLLLLTLLVIPAAAAEVPDELWKALPQGTEELLKDTDLSSGSAVSDGISGIFERVKGQAQDVLRQRLRGAVCILLVVLLCGAVDGFSHASGGPAGLNILPMAGALSVTMLAAGSLESLIGMGSSTIESLTGFSKVLLPVLAAATALSGAVNTATIQQVTTVFFADVLLQLIEKLLLPLVYLYIGALTAAACLPDGRLGGIAEAIKKGVTWALCGLLMIFTIYLSIVHIISGTADATAVKLAKATVSGVVPVVGSIISEAAETVLAGAGVLRGTIGVFGTLAVLGACAWPFLNLGIQYLLYKITAFLAGTIGSPELCKLIDGLGGAFGLVLGMTGTCALLLLISILSSVSAVIP